MNTNLELIKRLQDWYISMCNDDWEHNYGIFISNIDNPGWSLKVDLKDTYLYRIPFKELKIQRETENDWVICKVEEGNFQGYGGPNNLEELIGIFLDWAEDRKYVIQIKPNEYRDTVR
ncbi:immunity 53 family protein [Methylomonas koyamae]|uniref:immunity 53 family protein n=1 Tax=Methylomonas koyamae TaxID=702114 RepID=UPI002872EE33|nr:immunity 53 family protein [Methylomonas koyamae]WNB76608.1 immunity 53 family protein [Methylomonas koyamae]